MLVANSADLGGLCSSHESPFMCLWSAGGYLGEADLRWPKLAWQEWLWPLPTWIFTFQWASPTLHSWWGQQGSKKVSRSLQASWTSRLSPDTHSFDHILLVKVSHKAVPDARAVEAKSIPTLDGRTHKVTLLRGEGLCSFLQSIHRISPILRWRKKMDGV